MGAPLKPRKRHVPKSRSPRTTEMMKRRWAENREGLLAMVRAKAGRPEGVADGTTKQQIAALRPQAEAKAERIIAAMAQEDEELQLDDVSLAEAETIVDDEKAAARRVLKEAITIAIMPGNRATKLTAIRTVLDFTRAKPASTTNTNINAAEAFLEALVKKD
jgi:hypothetical protein